ncbi:Phage major capsid protein E [Albimonas donghaensis]|uniref:Phage major capsid protein E n=1 Tax=Albimonas donghaensis TaxID=356660 RepID=A0A1H3FGV4_9RHOB|nr:major capsid protein [Albimonas donghaensis]SDX90272.1 Phage major capsid protein E [Albimonas donghaensis]
MPDSYTTRTLVGVLGGLDRPQLFLLDTFFPDLALFDTETVDFDKLDRMTGLAPFVSPLKAGTPVAARGASVESFTPAYVKPKNELDASRPLRRRPGERFAGAMSASERRDLALVDLLEDQYMRVLRRKEWMASAALRTGAVTVEGEGFPAQSVNFGRASGLTKALLTSARWGESGVSPLDDVQTWADEVATTSGASATTVVMDPKAWALFRKDPQVAALLDYRYARSTEVELGPVARGEGQWATYVGSVGQFDVWTYSQPYTNEDGTAGNMMPDYTVILGGRGVEAGVAGYQAHGAIKDPRAGYQPLEIYPKSWIEDDPAVEWVMSQSAPLVIPARPNASLCATVR